MGLSIRDVAKACGVSTYTVSSVINEKGRVSQATRHRVQAKIRELGYDPSKNVPHARRSRHRRLALVLPFGQAATTSFYMRALSSCKKTCVQQKRETVIFSQNEFQDMLTGQFHRGRSQINADGVIFFAPKGGYVSMLDTLREWEVPVAVVRRQHDMKGVYSVSDDDYTGLKTLTEFMINRGHRCLGLIGPMQGGAMARQRINGFRDALEAHGLPFDERMIIRCAGGRQNKNLQPIRETAGPGVLNLRRQGLNITGLCLVHDAMAGKLLGSLHESGLKVPDDIAIGGFGNEPICTQLVPTITAVNMPIEDMVKKAVDLILNGDPDGQRLFVLPSKVIERESTPQR